MVHHWDTAKCEARRLAASAISFALGTFESGSFKGSKKDLKTQFAILIVFGALSVF